MHDRRRRWAGAGAGAVLAGTLVAGVTLTGCGVAPSRVGQPGTPAPSSIAPERLAPTEGSPRATPAPTPAPEPPAVPRRKPERARPAPPLASDGRPRSARLTIPALDLQDLQVRPHRGTPDDAQGTRIQDRGTAASPYGSGGLVGPGGLGNYLVTGHRTSSTQPFEDLPSLRDGARVHVDAGGRRYTYRIVDTRRTSFRSRSSLAKQSAAVPGRPGVRPTQAMITLSTCRTPEDRAEGNDWSDRFGNPEHRIDKIGVLVSISRA